MKEKGEGKTSGKMTGNAVNSLVTWQEKMEFVILVAC